MYLCPLALFVFFCPLCVLVLLCLKSAYCCSTFQINYSCTANVTNDLCLVRNLPVLFFSRVHVPTCVSQKCFGANVLFVLFISWGTKLALTPRCFALTLALSDSQASHVACESASSQTTIWVMSLFKVPGWPSFPVHQVLKWLSSWDQH